MNIVELLKLRGMDTSKKIKLVRHQDQRYDLYELMTTGHLETYQACQSRPILDCEYMVSFIGLPYSKARLYGVYKVGDRCRVGEVSLPKAYTMPEDPNNWFYQLEKVGGFEDLEERVVIDWGQSTRSWHQWVTEKEVVEVLPAGYARPFPGYLDFVLHFDELSRIFNHPEANREWQSALSNVAGIYLILQPSTGAQYVGSACGSQGIYGRWKNYAITGHGGNKLLKKICDNGSNMHREFRFSILRTLPKSLTQKEVIEYENFYKNKLGSRAFGLNEN
jgi:hypothetical protein